MKRVITALLLVLVLGLSSGCASVYTIATLDRQDHLVYSGFRFDGETIIHPFYRNVDTQPWYYVPPAIVDFPLSFAMDTVLLPFTIWTY